MASTPWQAMSHPNGPVVTPSRGAAHQGAEPLDDGCSPMLDSSGPHRVVLKETRMQGRKSSHLSMAASFLPQGQGVFGPRLGLLRRGEVWGYNDPYVIL